DDAGDRFAQVRVIFGDQNLQTLPRSYGTCALYRLARAVQPRLRSNPCTRRRRRISVTGAAHVKGLRIEVPKKLLRLLAHQRLAAARLDIEPHQRLGVRAAQVEAPLPEFH